MRTAGRESRARAGAPDAAAPLDEWLRWLEAGRGEQIDLGLERCREVAAQLGLNKPAPVVVTVAGTNGKGSTAIFLEQVLLSSGARVGATLSPHLHVFNERIRLHGEEVTDLSLIESFEAVEAARNGVPLNYFEYAVLAALTCFRREDLDFAILEIGLGGRLDAFNSSMQTSALLLASVLITRNTLVPTEIVSAVKKPGYYDPVSR